MNVCKCSIFARALLIITALAVPGSMAFAAKDAGVNPGVEPVIETKVKSGKDEKARTGNYGHTKYELKARKENVRKQREQQVSPEKRKVAIDALKAERFKVYQAKQAVGQSQPKDLNTK